jgi:hypothetical protein
MSWPKATDQHGKGLLGCFMSLAFVALLCYTGYQLIPLYYRANEFQSAAEREVDRAGARSLDPEVLRKSLMNLAAASQVPLEPKNLRIVKQPNQLAVEIRYFVPVNFLGYTHLTRFEFKLSSIVGSL